MSLADIKRGWILRQLGLSGSTLSEADLLNQMYANQTSGDTGWRNITNQLTNGWTATFVHIRRVNRQVEVNFNNLVPPGAGTALLSVPAGFRPSRGFNVTLRSGASTDVTVGSWDTAGTLNLALAPAPAGNSHTIMFTTDDSFPTVAYGTAV